MRKGFTLGLCVFLALTSLAGNAQTTDSLKINPTLVRVKELLRAKQPEKAVTLLQDELKKQPTNAQFLYALGYSYEINKEPNKALEAFRHANRLNPGFPGLAMRIRNLEATLNTEQESAGDDSSLSEEQKKARSLFREALKEKSFGNFDKAFALFADCVELDIGYLGGNDEGIIVTALNHYESKLNVSKDSSATLYYNLFRFFRGDREFAERELNSFLASKPAPELAAVAEKWLNIIRNQQATEKDLIISYLSEKKRKLVEVEDEKAKKGAFAPKAQPASGPAKIAQQSSTSSGVLPVIVSPGTFIPIDSFSKNPRFVHAVATINDPDPEVAALAAHQIGTFRRATPEALQGLISALGSDDSIVQLTALEALGKIGPGADEAVPAVVGWLESNTPWMKIQALLCLGNIRTQPQVAVPQIVKCLGSDNRNVSFNARSTLLRYGKEALPALQELLADSVAGSKKEIEEIILEIQGEN